MYQLYRDRNMDTKIHQQLGHIYRMLGNDPPIRSAFHKVDGSRKHVRTLVDRNFRRRIKMNIQRSLMTTKMCFVYSPESRMFWVLCGYEVIERLKQEKRSNLYELIRCCIGLFSISQYYLVHWSCSIIQKDIQDTNGMAIVQIYKQHPYTSIKTPT